MNGGCEMANLQERRDKSGKLISYSIRVHRGRGADGKQLKPWTATFEKECREGVTSDSRLRFEEYCNYVIGLKEQRGIKHSTIVRYRELTERLYPLPLGSAFGSGKSSGRKQQLMQTKRPETVRFMFTGTQCDLWGRPDGTGQKISREIISRLIFCSCCSFSIRIRQLPTSY